MDPFVQACEAHRAGKLAEARDGYRSVLSQDVFEPEVLRQLAIVECQLGDYRAAIDAASLCTAIMPYYSGAYVTLGTAYGMLGQRDKELECIEEAHRLEPTAPAVNWNLSLANLIRGRIKTGLEQQDWGYLQRERHLRTLKPCWKTGEDPASPILVWSEQGAGDIIMLYRWLYELRLRYPKHKIIFETREDLLPLFHGDCCFDTLYAQPKNYSIPYHFASHVSLLELPLRLGATDDVSCIPRHTPYVTIAPELSEAAKAFVKESAKHSYRVGLVWAGSKSYSNARHRDVPYKLLCDSFAELEIDFFTLQKGLTPEDQGPSNFIHIGESLSNWALTGAIMGELDAVVCCDTGCAHLAGALGVPVHLMLSIAHDWRWFLGRDTSPWYPSMKIYRQTELDDWTPVVKAVKDGIHKASEANRSVRK